MGFGSLWKRGAEMDSAASVCARFGSPRWRRMRSGAVTWCGRWRCWTRSRPLVRPGAVSTLRSWSPSGRRASSSDPAACQRASAAGWCLHDPLVSGPRCRLGMVLLRWVPCEQSRYREQRLRGCMYARRWNRRRCLSQGDDLSIGERLVPGYRLQGGARRGLHSITRAHSAIPDRQMGRSVGE